jgi:hypothetical protein
VPVIAAWTSPAEFGEVPVADGVLEALDGTEGSWQVVIAPAMRRAHDCPTTPRAAVLSRLPPCRPATAPRPSSPRIQRTPAIMRTASIVIPTKHAYRAIPVRIIRSSDRCTYSNTSRGGLLLPRRRPQPPGNGCTAGNQNARSTRQKRRQHHPPQASNASLDPARRKPDAAAYFTNKARYLDYPPLQNGWPKCQPASTSSRRACRLPALGDVRRCCWSPEDCPDGKLAISAGDWTDWVITSEGRRHRCAHVWHECGDLERQAWYRDRVSGKIGSCIALPSSAISSVGVIVFDYGDPSNPRR